MNITKFDEVIFNIYQEVWLVITVGGATIAVCITNT